MNKLHTPIALMALTFVFLSSCYREANLDNQREQEGEDLLTINSIVNTDSTVSVAALKTYFFSDTHIRRVYFDDLDMELWVNGKQKEKMQYNKTTHLYESLYKPIPDDEINVRTVFNGKPVEATDVMPKAVEIEDFSIERQGPMINGDWIVNYNITFTDVANEENYYFLKIDSYRKGDVIQTDYSSEFVFQQLARQINAYLPGWDMLSIYGLPFSDYGIDGKKHTLQVQENLSGIDIYTNMHGEERYNRTIKLYAISKNYYKYLVTAICNSSEGGGIHGGMIDLGISEPGRIHSNVEGGTGILGSYNLKTCETNIVKVLGSFE